MRTRKEKNKIIYDVRSVKNTCDQHRKTQTTGKENDFESTSLL